MYELLYKLFVGHLCKFEKVETLQHTVEYEHKYTRQIRKEQTSIYISRCSICGKMHHYEV